MRSMRSILIGSVVASLLATHPVWAADSLTLVGAKAPVAVKSDNLRIENGWIHYTEIISNRSKRSQIDRIKSIHLDKYKQLSQADKALDKKDYGKAANLYKSAYGRIKKPTWLKVWTGRRLAMAYDRSKQFDKAMILYVELLAKDSSAYVRSVQPQNPPSDKAKLKALVPVVDKALKSAKSTDHKKHLTSILAWLTKGGPAPVAASTAVRVSAASSRRSATVSQLKALVDAKKYPEALAAIEKDLQQPAAPLAALLYYQGTAQRATGKEMDALVSYMRVIVHFPAIRAYSQPARMEAGQLFVKRKQKQQAKRLWTEGLNSATRAKDAPMIKKFQALLDGA